MANKGKLILPIEGAYDIVVSEPLFKDPRVDALQSEVGKMKFLLQIQTQMVEMNQGKATRVETMAPQSVRKIPMTLDPHPISKLTASKFTKKSSMEFPKYAGDEDPMDWVGNVEPYFRFHTIVIEDKVSCHSNSILD